ncbi:MAG: hypothetical protein C4321_02965 [Chloroflexota bacterium]
MADQGANIRLADLLAAASSLAAYRLETAITLQHLRMALDCLEGQATFESLGGGVSPLIPRQSPPEPDDAVRTFARRWSDRVGGPFQPLPVELLAELRAELELPPD